MKKLILLLAFSILLTSCYTCKSSQYRKRNFSNVETINNNNLC